MITIWIWFNVARADAFHRVVREKVALLQLAHRADDPAPMMMNDPDRWQALSLLGETSQRGAVYRALQRYGEVTISAGTEGRASLLHALQKDGYAGDQTSLRQRLREEILLEARRFRVARQVVVDELAGYILVPSPMARKFQTVAAARSHVDLIVVLGDLRAPEGLTIVTEYLRGLIETWPDFHNVAHYHRAVTALQRIAPERAPTLIAALTGTPCPPPGAAVAPAGRAATPLVTPEAKCESRFSRLFARPFGAWIKGRRARRP